MSDAGAHVLNGCLAIKFKLFPWAEEAELLTFIGEALSPPPCGISGVEVVRDPDEVYTVRMKYNGLASMENCVRRTQATPMVRQMAKTVIDISTFKFWAGTNTTAPPDFDPLGTTVLEGDQLNLDRYGRVSSADNNTTDPDACDPFAKSIQDNVASSSDDDSLESHVEQEAGGITLPFAPTYLDDGPASSDSLETASCSSELSVPASPTHSNTSVAVFAPSRMVSPSSSRAVSALIVPPKVSFFWTDSARLPSGTSFRTPRGNIVLLFNGLPKPLDHFGSPKLFLCRRPSTRAPAVPVRHDPYNATRLVVPPPAADLPATGGPVELAPQPTHPARAAEDLAVSGVSHRSQNSSTKESSSNTTQTTATTANSKPRSTCVLATMGSGHMKRCRCVPVTFAQPQPGDQVLIRLLPDPAPYVAVVSSVSSWSRRKSAKGGGEHPTVLRPLTDADDAHIASVLEPQNAAVLAAAEAVAARAGTPAEIVSATCSFDLAASIVSVIVHRGVPHNVAQRALDLFQRELATLVPQRLTLAFPPRKTPAA